MRGREDAQLELLQRMVDGAPVAMLVVDAVGTITFVSDSSERLFGFTPDELVGTNMLDNVDLEWNPLALESIGAALEGSGLRLPMLFRIRTKDGGLRVVEVTANSQIDDPVVQGMAVYVRSWNEQSFLDDILEALAGDYPLDAKLELFVAVMGAETLNSDGAVLYAPAGTVFTRAVGTIAGESRFAMLSDPATSDHAADSPWGKALTSGTEQLVPTAELPAPLRQAAAERGYGWCWAYPVRGGEGRIDACLVMWRRDDRPIEESYLMWIRRLVRLTQLVLEQDESRSQLFHAANHDALTGLTNRASFFGQFQDLLDDPTRGPNIGVLYLDLDGFKPVNDTLGHGAGDAVLIAIAHRLVHRVRQGDVVARLGGDEFAVLCPDVHSSGELEQLAERLAFAAREPVTIGDHTVQVGASVGVCVSRSGACSINALIEAADGALYDAKNNDKGGWRVVSLPDGV